jgi:hypothetical protein
MLEERPFHVVWVRDGHGVGLEAPAEPDAVVVYAGVPVAIQAR